MRSVLFVSILLWLSLASAKTLHPDFVLSPKPPGTRVPSSQKVQWIKWRHLDFDGDGQKDLMLSSSALKAASGSRKFALYQRKGRFYRYLGTVWATTKQWTKLGKKQKHGWHDLEIRTPYQLTWHQEIRFRFHGKRYKAIQSRRHFLYDGKRGKLLLKSKAGKWRKWRKKK